MEKKSVLFINDSLWRSSGVFLSLLQVLRHIPYDAYDVTLYISAGAYTEPEAVGLLPPQVRLAIGEDKAHDYRDPLVFAPHLLSRILGALHLKHLAARFQKKARARIRKKKMRRQAKTYFGGVSFYAVVANTVPVCSEIARYVDAEKKYVLFHSSKAAFFSEQTRFAFAHFNRVIAVGEGVRQVLLQAYPEYTEKLFLITNYLDADKIISKSKAFDVPAENGRPVLCSCGRLEKEKGFSLVLNAAGLLKKQGFDFTWYIVGDGSEREELLRAVWGFGLSENVVFTGFQPNPYPYMAACDIYVQPSLEEAQPLATMEAQILGKAIVSTETVGGKTVLENGKKGVLTPVSADGLAKGIASLLRDPPRRAAYENLYSDEDDAKAKQAFETAWARLLSE